MSMNSIEKSLMNDLEKKIYSNFDVVDGLLSFKTFVEPGFIKCPVAIQEFTDVLFECIEKNRHPTLNPSVDDVYEFKDDNNTGKDAMCLYIENFGEFHAEKLDNLRNFLEITLPFKFMIVNAEPFIKDEKIEIKKAEVQTALFRREIK